METIYIKYSPVCGISRMTVIVNRMSSHDPMDILNRIETKKGIIGTGSHSTSGSTEYENFNIDKMWVWIWPLRRFNEVKEIITNLILDRLTKNETQDTDIYYFEDSDNDRINYLKLEISSTVQKGWISSTKKIIWKLLIQDNMTLFSE
ncbi:hypothetical protein BH23THE1_BH23THE1_29190 [soil metagenome]